MSKSIVIRWSAVLSLLLFITTSIPANNSSATPAPVEEHPFIQSLDKLEQSLDKLEVYEDQPKERIDNVFVNRPIKQ